jgi:MFS family permease
LANKTPGFLVFGYDQGVMAGLVGADNQFGRDFNHPQSGLLGTIVAIYEVGCFVGSMGIFVFGDYMGRRGCIRAGCLIACVGAAIQSGSISVGMLIAGRIVTGLVSFLHVFSHIHDGR